MIRLEGLGVRLAGFRLEDIHLHVRPGECFALLGPTGAGKTLLLETIAGFAQAHAGRVFLAGRDISDLAPEKRGLGLVYQDTSLFPHLSVAGNIGYGLRYAGLDRAQARRRVAGLAELLEIGHLLKRRPANLSGGEKKRVALARALAVRPGILLLDEPLTGLDPNLRQEARRMLARLHRETKATFLLVTHDFSEAAFLAGRAGLLFDGRLAQTGTVEQVFNRPATLQAAAFVGMKNIWPASLTPGGALVMGHALALAPSPNGRAATHLAIRPEAVEVLPAGSPAGINQLAARVREVEGLGPLRGLELEAGGLAVWALAAASLCQGLGLAAGREVALRLPPQALHAI